MGYFKVKQLAALISITALGLISEVAAYGANSDTAILAEIDYEPHFGFVAPGIERLKLLSIYATHYNIPTVNSDFESAQTIRLRDRDGRPISDPISRFAFCNAANQGSLRIRSVEDGNEYQVFNSSGSTKIPYADCSDVFVKNKKIGVDAARQAFFKVPFKFGEGVRGSRLIPYRSVAVDRHFIPYGSVLYIPSLRGFKTPYGIHDGYVIANDTGRGIIGNHIDVYVGSPFDPYPAFVSIPQKPKVFPAYLISESVVRAQLAKLTDWKF